MNGSWTQSVAVLGRLALGESILLQTQNSQNGLTAKKLTILLSSEKVEPAFDETAKLSDKTKLSPGK
ncbi:hypothetical protein [Arundinibacter roseus]|uniref:Uncharacterized protein n=1 Tax=Arundinibacter roseus TaxID=2070510 RepID=A0A4V2XAU0_9BACT|nr:hypothetical protein [Arundinibacter roseus]TDB68925.1 hypothetical protein EZE20_00890 [Arundinibacter roseus]